MEGTAKIDFCYQDCQKNHAASLGSYATDGCGEFILDQTTPAALQCAACGCHRNFHRKVSIDTVDYGNIHGGKQGIDKSPERNARSRKKRLRTKFTTAQKEKMLTFAEKLEWNLPLPKNDRENEVEKFCSGIGVRRKVFKVWMRNHKKSSCPSTSAANSSSSAQC